MKLKRILCGVDFSDNSVRAFQTAVALAKATRAEVSVVHVIEPLPMTDQDIFALEEKARTALEALVREWERTRWRPGEYNRNHGTGIR